MISLARSRWNRIRTFVVPASLLLVALGWLVLDGLRMRRLQLSKYSLPEDHSAQSLLDFMRKMDGSVQAASYFESSNTQSVCRAIREAYEILQADSQSLSAAEQREADYYHIHFGALAFLQGFVQASEWEVDAFHAASKEFISCAPAFTTREQLVSSLTVHVLESSGRRIPARDFGKWVLEQLSQRNELSGDLGKQTATRIEKVVNRLDMIHTYITLQSKTVQDQPFDLQALRGKVVLIEFWGTNCRPCIADFPALKRFYAGYKDRGFEIVGICLNAAPARVNSFVAQHQLPWIQLCEDKTASSECNQELCDRFGVDAVPTTLLIDQTGQVVAMGVRPMSGDANSDLEHWLDKLLPK